MDTMPRKPFLSHEKTRHGKMVWYFKRNGRRVRLPDVYGSEEFQAAYEAALSGSKPMPEKPKAKSGSLVWLVDQYKRSGVFARLAPATRRARDNILKQIIADPKNGSGPFVDITKAKIKAGIDKRAATPNAANNFLKTMSHLFKWAVEAGYIETNPCIGVSKLSVRSDGFHTWTVEQVERYRKRHNIGTKPRLAIDILLFLGLRRGDAVVVGRQHMKDGLISLRTEKTKQWVYLPVFKQLQESIDATPTGDLAFLTTEKGKPFSSGASFGNWFAKQCKAAGLPDVCRAHGLRKAGATIAADEGATAHELMAMYGWSRLSMAEIYTKEADKKKLARSASERLSNRM
ncbi:tyrosine-type recombinase/integrase [Agrobacterium vitis]|uniref:tyrosine-type recombinase/integrase n=2 Tax=Agrobacterium vitis TaxID=373 RepID=UPI001F4665B0|nr:tyrosine-type recombinase/integrase [Agrobacterium vitis]